MLLSVKHIETKDNRIHLILAPAQTRFLRRKPKDGHWLIVTLNQPTEDNAVTYHLSQLITFDELYHHPDLVAIKVTKRAADTK